MFFLKKILDFFVSTKKRIAHYIALYDPGYISFIYSLKALFAAVISALIAFVIFGFNIIIWAALIPIHLYFLNVVLVEKKQTIWYFVLFIVLTIAIVYVFYYAMPYPIVFGILLMFVGFVAGIIGSYQPELQRVINMSLIDGLIACIYTESNLGVTLFEQIATIALGGGIGLFTHFFMSFKKYGKFTRKYFPELLSNLELMVSNIHKSKNFIKIRYQVFNQIEFIKKIFNSKTAGIRDGSAIKNAKRALFYLYRIEEIYQCLNAIHDDEKVRDKKFAPIRREIISNIRELKKIFDGHSAHLKDKAVSSITPEDFGYSLVNIIKIIYNKLHSFRRGGEEGDYFVEAKEKRSFGVIFDSIKNRDGFFYYGIKYAFVLGIAIFIAEIFQLSHGFWIAMACVAIMRPNLGGVTHIGIEYLIGVIVGLVAGISLIFLTQNTLWFYVFFVLIVFFFIYFRAFPYGLWASFMMMAFIMMFSLVYGISYSLIFDRFMDIVLAFIIVVAGFFIFWPRYSSNEILPNIQLSLNFFYNFYQKVVENIDDVKKLQQDIVIIQKEFFSIYNTLDINIKESKQERKMHQDIKASRNSLKFLEFLNQHSLKLYYLLAEKQGDILKQQKELYINDLNLLKTRYEMLVRSIRDNTFYFKEQQDDRFMVEDIMFKENIQEIFEAQNELFKNIQLIKR